MRHVFAAGVEFRGAIGALHGGDGHEIVLLFRRLALRRSTR